LPGAAPASAKPKPRFGEGRPAARREVRAVIETAPFSLRPMAEVHFGPGRARDIAADAAAVGETDKAVVLVVDAGLAEMGLAERIAAPLRDAGAAVAQFADVAGEPKEAQVVAATEFVRSRDAGLVVCLGGGSAMDVGKVAATVARTGESPVAFTMDGLALPRESVPKICLPTTAGTGSELSSTNIFSNGAGRKVWMWGSETKPQRVVLDPELTLGLPPDLTAWTGFDAFAHALESCTNVHRHAANDLYAHRALGLIAGALETAVREPANMAARGAMLLGSAYAGIALDNCSAAFAHNISHALAALAPVHHGLATALGLEVVLAWQAAADDGPFAAAAEACGAGRDAAALAGWYADFLGRCGVERRLPAAFKEFDAAALAAEMRAPETRYMRASTVRTVTEPDIDRFAAAMMALA
jgi:alcohol dehydrogenase class IV